MTTINNGFRFFVGAQAVCSKIQIQPKSTLAFLSKIIHAKNDSGINLKQSQNFAKSARGYSGAPARPEQPDAGLKLKMALADFKLDPAAAREKWNLHKDSID